MMTIDTLGEFSRRAPASPRISLAMPMHKAAVQEAEQDLIRLENLIAQARRLATGLGNERDTIRRALEPAERMVLEAPTWLRRAHGLVIYASPQEFETHFVDHSPREFAYAGSRFCARPLLAATARIGAFLLLTLSQDSIQLYACTPDSADPMDLTGVPTSIDQAIGAEREERSVQHHAGGSRPGPGRRQPAIFHGQGRSGEEPVGEIDTFMARVAHAIDGLLADDRRTLVLAGVDELVSRYREHARYRSLANEHIRGSPAHARVPDLRDRAEHIVASALHSVRREAVERVAAALATSAGVRGLEQVIPAAAQARIGTLLLRSEHAVWGRFDEPSGTVERHEEQRPESDDLADLALTFALRTGAEIIDIGPDDADSPHVAMGSLRF